VGDAVLENRWIRVDGLRMRTRVRMNGRLPTHLTSCSSTVPPWPARTWHQRQRRLRTAVWVPELAGHGRSDNPPKVLDVCGHADVLDRWMDAVGLGRAVFLGNSYGCQVIAELAVRHASVSNAPYSRDRLSTRQRVASSDSSAAGW
jgi:pimeloyl-ACP methyl ester carboxylesterase